MKKILITLILFIVSVNLCFAIDDILIKADQLYEQEKFEEGFALLKGTLSSSLSKQQQAAIYWRLARFQLYITDDAETAGVKKGDVADMFTEGRDYAQMAIDLFPDADAYFWHSSNLGRYGETKGVLNSLGKAKPMKKDLIAVISYNRYYSDAFFVLGRLHFLLPGWPISFGDEDEGISFARRAIELYDKDDLKIDYYKSLAEILWERNWDVKDRNKKIPKMAKALKKADNEFERNAVYEFTLGLSFSPEYTSKKLGEMTDREEAQLIIDWLMTEYAKIPSPSRLDKKKLQDVKDMIADEWD